MTSVVPLYDKHMHKTFLLAYKVGFSLLGFSALITEIAVLSERGLFHPWDFFSFFTVESNFVAAVALMIGALALSSGSRARWVDNTRGAATLYMLITGIVFSALLSGLDPKILTAVRWDNTVLHYIMPFVLMVDWLIDPPKRRVAFWTGMFWLIYPVSYVIYTLIRGLFVDWYPYPFLSPQTHGYFGVLAVSVSITIIVTGLIWFLTRVPFSVAKRT